MAAACQLLVMAVLVVMTSCRLTPRGDDWNTEDRVPRMKKAGSIESEIQVLPSEYTVHRYNNYSQLPNDSTCEYCDSGCLAVCSRSRGAPKLIDCDLGSKNGLLSNSNQQFYTLRNNKLRFNHKWLDFSFNEEFTVEAVQVHYVCISTNDDPGIKVELQYSESNTIIFNDFGRARARQNIKCQNRSDLLLVNKLRIEIPNHDQHREIECDDKIAIKIQFTTDIEINFHLSEVQFLKDESGEEEDCSIMITPTPIFSCVIPQTTHQTTMLSHSHSSTYHAILTPVSSFEYVSNSFSVIPVFSTPPDTQSRASPISVDTGGGGGGQGSVIAGAVAGILAGVLVILIAVAIVCLTVIISVNKRSLKRRKGIEDAAKERDGGLANPAYTTTTLGQAAKTDNKFTNPTYAPSAIGQALKTDDKFANPTYSPTVSGHAVTTDDRFTNPTYSTTAVSHIAPRLQQYNTPSDRRGEADKDAPQYAVLEDPTSIAAASTVNQPREYEEIDDFAPSPNSSPALVAVSDQPCPTASYNKLASLSHSSKLPRPASNVDLPPIAEQPYCDSPVLEHTYSQLDRKLPGGKEVPDPSYSHLLHGLQNGKGKGGGGVATGSSYSHLLHGPGGGDREQQRETTATTHHMYSHLIHDGGGRGMTQNGASESAYFHITDCHT